AARTGGPLGPAVLADARQRCLTAGHHGALICLALWLVAGIVYPLALGLAVGPLSPELFLHFMASLALCGLVAVSYPFFGVTFLSVRAVYPALFRLAAADTKDLKPLGRLDRRTRAYLLLAAAVPMLALTALVVIGSRNRLA